MTQKFHLIGSLLAFLPLGVLLLGIAWVSPKIGDDARSTYHHSCRNVEQVVQRWLATW